MKTSIIVAAVLLAMPLAATAAPTQQANDAEASCRWLGGLAEGAARDREGGLPEGDAMLFLQNNIEDPNVRQWALNAVSVVYQYPFFRPSEENRFVYQACMNQLDPTYS